MTLLTKAGGKLRLSRPVNSVANHLGDTIHTRPHLNRLIQEVQYRVGMWDGLDDAVYTARRCLDTVEHMTSPEAKILDLGCGTAINLPLEEKRFAHYHGVDISPTAIGRAMKVPRSRATFEVSDVLTYRCAERYDAIMLREILCYFPPARVNEFLGRLRDMLWPDGRILIVSSNNPNQVREQLASSCLHVLEEKPAEIPGGPVFFIAR